VRRMGIDANGNRVPVEDLMSPEDREDYLRRINQGTKKKEVVQSRLEKERAERMAKAAEAVKGAEGRESSTTTRATKVPEGCSECSKPDAECGLRQHDYCTLSPEQMCDLDMEKADIKSGHFAPPPRGGDKPREIDTSPLPVYKERTPAELEAQRAKHAARFDCFTAKELKAKCDKVNIPYKGNASKVVLIKELKRYYDEPEAEESSASKL
jgi:hypothetical protein